MHIYNACTHILICMHTHMTCVRTHDIHTNITWRVCVCVFVRMCLAFSPIPLPSPFVSRPTPRIISMPLLTCYVMDLSHHTSHSSHRNAYIHRIHSMVSHHITFITSYPYHHITFITSHPYHHITFIASHHLPSSLTCSHVTFTFIKKNLYFLRYLTKRNYHTLKC